MNWRSLLALVMGIELAACSLLSPDAPAPVPPSAPPTPGNAAKTAPAPRPTPHAPVVKPPAPAKSSAGPEELVGLDEETVRKLLGDPVEARNDGVARILTFRAEEDCAINVILFMDVKAGSLRVLSSQLATGSSHPAVAKACYGLLRGSR